MRKLVILTAVLFIAACASSNNNAKVDIPQPDIEVQQLSSTPAVAEHVTGGVPVNFGIAVSNKADIPITLKRINISSIGTGGYNVPNNSRPFDKVIQPGTTEQVSFWAGANADPSIAGVNGAVALRVIAQFDSSKGAFETSTVHQVQGRLP